MAITYIPAQLRQLTSGVELVEIEATSIREVVEGLEQRYPGIEARLCKNGQLSSTLQVSIDGVMSSQGLRAKLKPDSEVHFIPAIAGG